MWSPRGLQAFVKDRGAVEPDRDVRYVERQVWQLHGQQHYPRQVVQNSGAWRACV